MDSFIQCLELFLEFCALNRWRVQQNLPTGEIRRLHSLRVSFAFPRHLTGCTGACLEVNLAVLQQFNMPALASNFLAGLHWKRQSAASCSFKWGFCSFTQLLARLPLALPAEALTGQLRSQALR